MPTARRQLTMGIATLFGPDAQRRGIEGTRSTGAARLRARSLELPKVAGSVYSPLKSTHQVVFGLYARSPEQRLAGAPQKIKVGGPNFPTGAQVVIMKYKAL